MAKRKIITKPHLSPGILNAPEEPQVPKEQQDTGMSGMPDVPELPKEKKPENIAISKLPLCVQYAMEARF